MKLETYEVEYDSNNSGGSWWLSDDDWRRLAVAGWHVRWARDERSMHIDADGRWLGALATRATVRVEAYSEHLAEQSAIAWWEDALPGQYASAAGCDCCGQPHYFSARLVTTEDGE